MKRFALALVLAVLGIPGLASADAKQVCVDAYKQAQDLKSTTSLLAARTSLRVCGNASCAAFIVKDCTDWLAEVESRIPTVVFTAKGASGNALADVSVESGGKPLASSIDGKARELDPGSYEFTFVATDGRKVVVKTVVLEGQKGQVVTATFADAVPSPTSAAPAGPDPSPTTRAPRSSEGNMPRWIGLGVAASGVVAMTIGSILYFGGRSRYDAAVAACTLGPGGTDCPVSQQSAIESDADRASKQKGTGVVIVGIGAAALVGGLVLFAISPSSSDTKSAKAGVSVQVGLGSLFLGGQF